MASCPLDYSHGNYSCATPYPNCTAPAGLQLDDLWQITQGIAAACPTDNRLFSTVTPALTQAACVALVGTGWTSYRSSDIFSRLATWKFPLLQLVALVPKPPFGLKEDIFVVVRLLGNPIGTLKNLLLKIGSCQSYVSFWNRTLVGQGVLSQASFSPLPLNYGKDKIVRDLARISVSFDEWDFRASEEFRYKLSSWLLSSNTSVESKLQLLETSRQTSERLSAERSAGLLPVAIALVFFVFTIAFALIAGRDGATSTSYRMFETFDLTFASLYLWILPITVLGNIVNFLYTSVRAKHIVQQLIVTTEQQFSHTSDPSLGFSGRDALLYDTGSPEPYPIQVHHGSSLWSIAPVLTLSSTRWMRFGSLIFASFVVLCSLSTGILMAYYTPPVGFGCESGTELTIAALWLANGVLLDSIPVSRAATFWWSFVKDSIVAAVTVTGSLLPVVGVLNRCSCYTTSSGGLSLPQTIPIASLFADRFKTAYPIIAFLSIGLHLFAIPAIVCWYYSEAVKVFLNIDPENWTPNLRKRASKFLNIHHWRRDSDRSCIGRTGISYSSLDSNNVVLGSSSPCYRSKTRSILKHGQRRFKPTKMHDSHIVAYESEKESGTELGFSSSRIQSVLIGDQVDNNADPLSGRRSVAFRYTERGYSQASLGPVSYISTSKPSSVFTKDDIRPESIAPSIVELDEKEQEFADELAKRVVRRVLQSTSGQKSCAPGPTDGRGSAFSSHLGGNNSSGPPSKRPRMDSEENNGGSSGNGGGGDDHTEFGTPRTVSDQPLNIFACPYTKFDPERYSERNQREKNYRSCAGKYLTDISRLKQHLYRVHKLPMWYCGTCFRVFDSRPALHAHGRTRPPCDEQEPRFEEMMTDEQYEEIKPRERCTPSEAWYRIYKVLFPGAILPVSPYVSSCDPIAVRHFAQLFRAFGPQEMYRLLQSRPLQLETSTREIVREAFETAMADYLALSQGHMQSSETLVGIEASMLSPQHPAAHAHAHGAGTEVNNGTLPWPNAQDPYTTAVEEPDLTQTAGYQAWYHETVDVVDDFDMLKVIDSTGMQAYENQQARVLE